MKDLREYAVNAVSECREAFEEAVRVQPALNAVITMVDPSEQLEHLPETGALKGVPVALKDNVSTRGILTTGGSRILSNYVPVFDATITARLKEAGAVIIAKTAMDELAMGGTGKTCYTGATRNPWDGNRISGGSSSGSAALVASGAVRMAIGSDTGDSIRKPAGYCGVVGVKPTYGRISRYGVLPYASSLDHVGFFTRGIKDACVSLKVLAGRDDRDMTSSFREVPNYEALLNSDLSGRRLAVFGNVLDAIKDSAVKEVFYSLVERLKEKGAAVETVYLKEDLMKAIVPVYYIIANCEATSNHSNLDGLRFGVREPGADMKEIMINSRTRGFGELVRRRFVIGSYGLADENQERLFRKAQKVRRLIVEEVKNVFASFDALLAPSSGTIAPLLTDEDSDRLSDAYLIAENHMVIGNLSGYPSMTVPMGFEAGCPLGLNMTCRPFEETEMFNIGLAVEEITGYEGLKAEVK